MSQVTPENIQHRRLAKLQAFQNRRVESTDVLPVGAIRKYLDKDYEKNYNSYDSEDGAEDEDEALLSAEEDIEEIPFELTLLQRIMYGLPMMGQLMMFLMLGFWVVNFYLGQPPTPTQPGTGYIDEGLFSIFNLLARLTIMMWPIFGGYLSDRTPHNFMGKRLSWMLFFSFVYPAAFLCVFFIPIAPYSPWVGVWYCCFAIIQGIGLQSYNLAWGALMPELTQNLKERTQLAAFQGVFGVFGSLFASLVGPINTYATQNDLSFSGVQIAAIFCSATNLITCLLPCYFLFGLEKNTDGEEKGDIHFFREMIGLLKNKAFLCLCLFFSLSLMGSSNYQAGDPYLYSVVLETENGIIPFGQGLTWLGYVQMMCLVVASWSIFAGSRASSRFGISKKRTSMMMMFISGTSVLSIYFVQYLQDPAALAIPLGLIIATGQGPLTALVNAMQADCIDYGTKQDGIKGRAGLYGGTRAFVMGAFRAIATTVIPIILTLGRDRDDYFGILLLYLLGGGYIYLAIMCLLPYPIHY
eukprot:Lithocolla_globosa_v1_NODE_1625_length_2439_cov_4.699664.p1 type:complete len:525 gc:universal NODE_1625_length_2439_cov_4.699664:1575-1(-)